MNVEIHARRVLAKCEALQRAGLWAEAPRVQPSAWLSNFKESNETALAAALLDRFIFFSDRAVNALLRGAFRKFVEERRAWTLNKAKNEAATQALFSRVTFTRIEGEEPNPTDSGYLFCRKVRQEFGVSEEQIVDPFFALERALEGRPVVFLDDFLGTGQQLINTWERTYRKAYPHSFSDAFEQSRIDVSYICLMATTSGLSKVSSLPVRVFSCHEATGAQSIAAVDEVPGFSVAGDLQGEVKKFLQRHASHLLLVKHMQQDTFAAFGFGNCGLTVAFEHSVPDASLPLFWARSTNPDWVPLVERS